MTDASRTSLGARACFGRRFTPVAWVALGPPALDSPILPFETPAHFNRWLRAHHATSDGLWLRIFKKDSGHATLTYQEALAGGAS